METRNCQNCKNDFTIESEDFSFYEKIKVPPPTFCSNCRSSRRLIWRNERSLYKRECALCKKSLISMYNDQAPVMCSDCWNGDKWDQFSNAREYDFKKNFFEQLGELFKINPRFYSYKLGHLVNSEFANYSMNNKNAYLSFSVIDCEDVLYSTIIDQSTNSMDCFNVVKIDGCYQNILCEGNYNTHYAIKSQNCIDSYYIYDCVNCSNCFLSSNLRNQQYVFKNRKLSKEEYFKKIEEYDLSTHTGTQNTKREFDEFMISNSFHKFAFTYAVEKFSGDYINNAKNIKESFGVHDSENISYSFRVLHSKDSMDNSGVGYGEMIYESMAATANTFMDKFCYITIQGCRECEYSLILKNCTNCFACVGLTNAKYCILNKQYNKDEYFMLVEKIKSHMNALPYRDQKGRVYSYGEFFPYDMCPFGYNESNANDYFPLSKNEAEDLGYPWKEKDNHDYKITINSENLSDGIKDISEDILNEVVSCPNEGIQSTQCTGAFKIVPNELSFYKQKNLPIPRYCPNCRHYQRLNYINPMKLWRRACMKEGRQNEFETSYAPDRPEIVYCEKCYQQEVY